MRRTWTDQQLRQAIPAASSWRDVVGSVGLQSTGANIANVRSRAEALHLDVSHLASTAGRRRTYTDDQLRASVSGSRSWVEVEQTLGVANGKALKARAASLGLSTSHFAPRGKRNLPESVDLPFTTETAAPLHRTALAVACQWFLGHGYNVSVPVEPCSYDLITESDEGLKRVQVKSSTYRTGRSWQVSITKSEYDGNLSKHTNGPRRRRCYSPTEVDLFFVLAADGAQFIVPVVDCDGRTVLYLHDDVDTFRV